MTVLDGAPVLDIKPLIKGFELRGAVSQPDWADEIMADYW